MARPDGAIPLSLICVIVTRSAPSRVFGIFVSGTFRLGGSGMLGSHRIWPWACALVISHGVAAAEAGVPEHTLDERIQELKSEVVRLNRDLMVLEEELLFPPSTQVAVFVAMDAGNMFSLDSVQVKLDDVEVADYLYTTREVQALKRGGVQRIFLGNVRAGQHSLIAYFVGKGPLDRDYRRGTTMRFDKGSAAKYIELRITDDADKAQPAFRVRQWQ
jgi:hypothetical protein